MIKDNVFDTEYVSFPQNNISRRCTSSGGTMFIRGAEVEQSKVSDIPGRKWKANSFQKRTEFKTKVNSNMKECIEAMRTHA